MNREGLARVHDVMSSIGAEGVTTVPGFLNTDGNTRDGSVRYLTLIDQDPSSLGANPARVLNALQRGGGLMCPADGLPENIEPNQPQFRPVTAVLGCITLEDLNYRSPSR